MSKDTSSKRIDAIAEEAAEWYVQLKDANARTKSEFAAWLKTSPEHVKEFLAIAALWEALPDLPSQPSVEKLIELATQEDNVVALSTAESVVPKVPLETAHIGGKSKTRRNWAGLAAATTVAAVIIGGALTLLPPPEDLNLYQTALGEQLSIPLPDGSLVTLNTQSILRVDYSEDYRDIRLTDGEALFDVAKNPERPFRVVTEHVVIQAVGTQFNVHHDQNDVTVTVVEGIVDVASTSADQFGDVANLSSLEDAPPVISEPIRLTAGQQARVQSRSGEVAVVDISVDKAIAWQERRLVFESMSLKAVIDEFNRYNDPPLMIDHVALEQLPINGVFRSNDRESFVEFLSQMQLAESHTRADGTIVLRGLKSD